MGLFKRKKKVNVSEKDKNDEYYNKITHEKSDKLKKSPSIEKEIYKKRLMSGESEESARAGLSIFENDIYMKPGWEIEEMHKIPNKKEVQYPGFKEKLSRAELIRPTDIECPKCSHILYNTKLDGEHYYCHKCKKQYKIYG